VEKVDDLAKHFHKPRAAIVCQIMHWGLSRERTETLDHGESQGPVHHLYFYVVSELHARVKKAATAAGGTIAPWLRQMVRQIAITDVPASWEEERSEERSHDSSVYSTRFVLRLDEASRTTLQNLVERFHVSKADLIRQLIAQATDDDFPRSWHTRAAERRAQQSRSL
jgi:hypothetical protein